MSETREPGTGPAAATAPTAPRVDEHDRARVMICVFAKPPVAGAVKTRLAAALGDALAAELARAFLRDTWGAVARLPWARPVVATTDPAAMARELPSAEAWSQGEGDLGARIERVLRRALGEADAALAIGADTPGLPVDRLAAARDALADADAVLGPCDDGGFYLLGLRRCPAGLLGGLPWSDADTFARTRDQLAARGLRPALLPGWFDVDHGADLERLRALLARRELHAPATAALLAGAAREGR